MSFWPKTADGTFLQATVDIQYLGHEGTLLFRNKYSEDDIIKILGFLVDNTFVVFARNVYQETIGVLMDNNCALPLADIFLYSRWKSEFVQSPLSAGNKLI